MTDDQRRFLNPTMRDVILSSLEQDSFGENAKKKRARRRMCFIDGNAKSYSKWLNSDARMEKYADHNELTGIVAELVLEKDEEKKRTKEKRAANDKEKERNKLIKEIEKQQLKDKEMPLILEDINKGLLFVMSKNMPWIKKILSYHYNVEDKQLNKMKRNDVDILITEKMTASNNINPTATATTTTTTHNDNDNDNNNNVP